MLEVEPPGAEIEPTKVSVKLVTEVPSYLPRAGIAGIHVGFMASMETYFLEFHSRNYRNRASRYVVCIVGTRISNRFRYT